ncbi:TauD/TfdA dioxygenase family protein [Sphingorhabdus sp.]|jgi:alpha-ketoglutarate-dependent taurine dioxygenase|uniref:TauD/TfdA dioxygenase family protein n=1 Tax=Sphingorhabdus sp. TaxID=1902408 RepID=UPI0037CB235E
MTTLAHDVFEVEQVKPLIGAAITSNKETLLSGKYAKDIRAMLEDRGVIVFKKVDFTDEEQVAFTKTLGNFVQEMTGDTFKISMDKAINPVAEYTKGAFYWHIDGTMDRVPLFASMLSARRLAPVGGNTAFCNTYAAWDALPDEEKAQIENLRVVHSLVAAQLFVEPEPTSAQFEGWNSLGTNEIPLVWTHMSGHKSLVLGSTAEYIVGMNPIESRRLLIKLREWCTQDQFSLSHAWTIGDAVIWNNTGTMHRAEAYPLDCDRLMVRTKLAGEEAFA